MFWVLRPEELIEITACYGKNLKVFILEPEVEHFKK